MKLVHYSVRLLVIILGAIAIGWIAWKQHRNEDLRPKTFALAVLVLLAVGFLEFRAQSAEARFGKVASAIARRDVGVRCQGVFGHLVDIGQELGTVQFDEEGEPADVTHLKRDACKWLKEYEKGDKRVTYNSAVAVNVLAHEAIHLRGWPNEALTECYAMQHSAKVARMLGASPERAQALSEFYWNVVYPDMPDEYRTPDCVDGGRLDLHKNSDVWP